MGTCHLFQIQSRRGTNEQLFWSIQIQLQGKIHAGSNHSPDGSSVFGENVRWATFPSVAAGWAFSDEAFMKPLYWLSFGKIRASWGRSGQKFSQRYLAHGLMAPSGETFLGEQGMGPDLQGGLLNRDLSWEKTDHYDFGLDVSFLNYRLKMTLDYYYRYTKGQLQKIDLPGDWSYQTFQWQNALAVSNEGLELELTADILRETAVKWRMKLNVSKNWNRFEKSNNGRDFLGNIIGKSLYNIRTYKTDGFYNSMDELQYYPQPHGFPTPLRTTIGSIFYPGTRKLVDMNNDGVIMKSLADQYYAAVLSLCTWRFYQRDQVETVRFEHFFHVFTGKTYTQSVR